MADDSAARGPTLFSFTRRVGRADRDRGAVLIEFALTMPLLVMLLLGMFTGGIAFNQKLAITNGVREGSRYGATLPINATCDMTCWLNSVADVVQSASEGELGASVATRSICVAYIAGPSDTNATSKLVRTSGGSAFTGGTCFADDAAFAAEKHVQVLASRQGSIDYLVGKVTPTLTSQAVTRFEG